ncbi:MAG TPA: VOC family protein [Methyloceanibacter sp.]|jgi:predicted 3-demethylubiquinone-9 3-methyltransferase (glyoxalase superfamily)
MKAIPFLMFQGDAKKALALWREAFPEIEVLDLEEHPDGPQAGQIARARIRLGGSEWRLYDSPPVHDFTFTPSTSIFVDCDNETQLRRLVDKLGEDGKVMMPLNNYGFSALFAWLADRFGVSWQLNLP